MIRFIEGDAIKVMRAMAPESFHTCITSPPYWQLREYGTPVWKGGSAECKHKTPAPGRGPDASVCGECGAKRVKDGQIGLERSPEMYVRNLVKVFREIRRVLRKDGTVWLNIGDSYNSGTSAQRRPDPSNPNGKFGLHGAWTNENIVRRVNFPGLKTKDLCLMPARLMLALQRDGWWVRSEIVWHKPNPLPESIRDRPVQSHEKIYLLSRSPRYYYDAKAVMEPVSGSAHSRGGGANPKSKIPSGWETRTGESHREKKGRYPRPPRQRANEEFSKAISNGGLLEFRNRRSVWTVPTSPTREEHFATYPIELIEPCVLAGCPPDGVVFDPFAGIGTTALAAIKNGRNFVGIELYEQYIRAAEKRIKRYYPLFA